MSTPAEAVASPTAVVARRRSGLRRTVRRFRRQRAAVVSALVLAIVFIAGAIVPRYAPGANINLSPQWLNHPPMLSGWHIFGTDGIGRDVLIRTLQGLQTSEQSAIYGTLLAAAIGVLIGGLAGIRGGWTDAALMRLADMLGFFPAVMLLLIAFFYFLPMTVVKATLILACYLWIPVARIVRAEFATLRTREFVDAARSLGASERRIFLRHLLPNASSTVVVAATSLLGQVIILEATVEFFGLGASSEIRPTLGNLIGDGQRNAAALGWRWWTWAFPAILLVLILVCANLLGDGVAQALRPTDRR
jgi:ABC-type dipeptide/oligopeptide/nickel transport system permease subunit